MQRPQPTPKGVALFVQDLPAVMPSLLWSALGGDGDFAPGWVFDLLRRLGYGPHPAGFWWRSDLPLSLARPMEDAIHRIEAAYPIDDD